MYISTIKYDEMCISRRGGALGGTQVFEAEIQLQKYSYAIHCTPYFISNAQYKSSLSFSIVISNILLVTNS